MTVFMGIVTGVVALLALSVWEYFRTKQKEKSEEKVSYYDWKRHLMDKVTTLKLKDDLETDLDLIPKGTLFVIFKDKIWRLATPTKPRDLYYWGYSALKDAYESELFEEVNLYEQKWVHPHLNKEVLKMFPSFKGRGGHVYYEDPHITKLVNETGNI